MKSKDEAPQKAPYRSPRLLVYGDVIELTQASKKMSMQKDGGSGMMKDNASN